MKKIITVLLVMSVLNSCEISNEESSDEQINKLPKPLIVVTAGNSNYMPVFNVKDTFGKWYQIRGNALSSLKVNDTIY